MDDIAEKGFKLVVELAQEYGMVKHHSNDEGRVERAHGRYHAACQMFAIFTEQTVDDVMAVTYVRYVLGISPVGDRLF